MAVATVRIKEFNGTNVTSNPPLATSGNDTSPITNLNLTSQNQAESSSASFPVTAGTRSFSKWICYELFAKGTSNSIDNFQVWMTPPHDTEGILYECNLSTTLGNTTSTYPDTTGPTSTDFQTGGHGTVINAVDFPTADPTLPNIGINEADTGLFTDVAFDLGNLSDFIAVQLVTTGLTPPGNLPQKTFHFQYDEQ